MDFWFDVTTYSSWKWCWPQVEYAPILRHSLKLDEWCWSHKANGWKWNRKASDCFSTQTNTKVLVLFKIIVLEIPENRDFKGNTYPNLPHLTVQSIPSPSIYIVSLVSIRTWQLMGMDGILISDDGCSAVAGTFLI